MSASRPTSGRCWPTGLDLMLSCQLGQNIYSIVQYSPFLCHPTTSQCLSNHYGFEKASPIIFLTGLIYITSTRSNLITSNSTSPRHVLTHRNSDYQAYLQVVDLFAACMWMMTHADVDSNLASFSLHSFPLNWAVFIQFHSAAHFQIVPSGCFQMLRRFQSLVQHFLSCFPPDSPFLCHITLHCSLAVPGCPRHMVVICRQRTSPTVNLTWHCYQLKLERCQSARPQTTSHLDCLPTCHQREKHPRTKMIEVNLFSIT